MPSSSSSANGPRPRKSASSIREREPLLTSVVTAKTSPVTAVNPACADGSSSFAAPSTPTAAATSPEPSGTPRWIGLALASGVCAAFNGVFAKLTTTELTSGLTDAATEFLYLSPQTSLVLDYAIRGTFLALNLVFNGIMWSLFTAALSRGSSTIQVSIINTSANFVATALLGSAIFAERLPPLWWLGAALLVAGNVIIGRKEDAGASLPEQSAAGGGGPREYADEGKTSPAAAAPVATAVARDDEHVSVLGSSLDRSADVLADDGAGRT